MPQEAPVISRSNSTGVFRFANSAAAHEIAAADIGWICYAVDDQTVARTHGGSIRSPAGVIAGVDALGVWVSLDDEDLAAHLAGRRVAVPLRVATLVGASVRRILAVFRRRLLLPEYLPFHVSADFSAIPDRPVFRSFTVHGPKIQAVPKKLCA